MRDDQVISAWSIDQILDHPTSAQVKVLVAFTGFTNPVKRGHKFRNRVFFGSLFKRESCQNTVIDLLPLFIELKRHSKNL